ncbi:MAG: hydroxymethylglutaryl-CoA synthase family protein [Alphaproteobacteria bacterium]|nr:hydroxymethylglutaryl-CoA synthase family protein [Alphaproteobacteria bacterium]
MLGITAYGGYIPRLRLQRKAAASANAWYSPGLMGQAKGERAMANWDEDSITMAVEAARDALPGSDPFIARKHIDAIYLASTTLPFADRQNAGIVAAALSLSEDIQSTDVSGSQRAGTTALIAALQAVRGGSLKNALVVAADRRRARAASPQELQFGDGAAGLCIGMDGVIAEFLGSHSVTVDFIDHFRGEAEAFDYNWEERWIRDEGIVKIVPRAVAGALAKAGVAGAAVDHFIFPTVFAKLDAQVAKSCGIDPAKVRGNLSDVCGETGSAHALVMLSHALEEAKPGQVIVACAFGQGCDALVFRTTGALEKAHATHRGVGGSLKRRKEETNYMKWLSFNGLVEVEKGMRAEQDKKTALTVTYRKRDMLFGLVGGKCRKCGTAQFPRARICVNPNCKAVDSQDPFSYAELPGKILSWSADFLTYSMDPPQHYGMVTFEEGGRFLADFTDVDRGTFDSGTPVRMVFRIKDFDDRRGFRRYFWKAVPQGN